jgi:hypothetical protein
MERVRFFDHDGHRILLLDCTGCGPDELLEVFEQASSTITAEPPHSLLTLADFTGAQFNRKAADQMKVTATYNRAYVKRSAIVGVEDLPDVYYHNLVSFSAREFPAFKTREEAMDWLVSEKTERAKTG